jgi:hypothetical protein
MFSLKTDVFKSWYYTLCPSEIVEKHSNIYGRKVYSAPVTVMHFRAQLGKMGWGLDL